MVDGARGRMDRRLVERMTHFKETLHLHRRFVLSFPSSHPTQPPPIRVRCVNGAWRINTRGPVVRTLVLLANSTTQLSQRKPCRTPSSSSVVHGRSTKQKSWTECAITAANVLRWITLAVAPEKTLPLSNMMWNRSENGLKVASSACPVQVTKNFQRNPPQGLERVIRFPFKVCSQWTDILEYLVARRTVDLVEKMLGDG